MKCQSFFRLLGKDAHVWRPNRWLPDVSDPDSVKRIEDHFMAFGFGPRVCVGRDLAILEARSFLMLILMAFEIRPAAGFSKVAKQVESNGIGSNR